MRLSYADSEKMESCMTALRTAPDLFLCCPVRYAPLLYSMRAERSLFANCTNEVMASRFTDVMWLIDQIMWKSFDKRLADFLLNEAEIEGAYKLKITHEIIGNRLGNPREIVTRMLKYFVNEGFITLSRGTIEIINRSGLEKLANE